MTLQEIQRKYRVDAVTAIRLKPDLDRLETLRRLAKEATNGWACYAKREIEHREIARLHKAIDAATAGQE